MSKVPSSCSIFLDMFFSQIDKERKKMKTNGYITRYSPYGEDSTYSNMFLKECHEENQIDNVRAGKPEIKLNLHTSLNTMESLIQKDERSKNLRVFLHSFYITDLSYTFYCIDVYDKKTFDTCWCPPFI